MAIVWLFFIAGAISSTLLTAGENSRQPDVPHVIMVPAGGHVFAHNILNFGLISRNATRSYYRHRLCCNDMGQEGCVKTFLDQMDRDPGVVSYNGPLELYGLCLGASVILNSIPLMKEEYRKRIRLVILEGALVNRHHSVDHYTKNGLFLPFSRVWIPPLVPLTGDFYYNPFARGVSKTLGHDVAVSLQSEAAILLMHDKNDVCTPISDVVRLKQDLLHYHKNTVLVSTNSGYHLGLLNTLKPDERTRVCQKIRRLYQQCALPILPLLDHYALGANQSSDRDEEKNAAEGHVIVIDNPNSYQNGSLYDDEEVVLEGIAQKQEHGRRRARCIRNVVDVVTILGIASWRCFEKYKTH